MYDYISIHSDKFASFIKTDVIGNFLILNMNCTKLSTLVFTKELSGSSIIIRGINANLQGNYAYDSADEFTGINLIEIEFPDNSDGALEDEILKIAQKISNEFLWKIDLRE
ncbi:hypothetical protein HMPREF1210_00593 [Paenisporosarcina sp. HGH0030]|uniref:hypothetical protein n=1 Tax=Paenisporosarcina sp. HGH0030 TaxID=1078085 RepID=UPI00034E9966|nr:hypothetical protein [Paenisporosarcina sp. HGH0030]EPD53770.1 hypothetical protein HMPREF1210_00593 [Paenisporosarcina sp. HGH0030]